MDRPLPSGVHHARLAWLPLLASCAVLLAMFGVQFGRVYGEIEAVVRLVASAFGFVGVPVLLALAFKDRLAKHQESLSWWRRGFGLSALVALLAAWLVYWGMGLLAWSGVWGRNFSAGDDWIGLALACSLLGFGLALALKGNSRPQAIAAALLLWASVQAGIYR